MGNEIKTSDLFHSTVFRIAVLFLLFQDGGTAGFHLLFASEVANGGNGLVCLLAKLCRWNHYAPSAWQRRLAEYLVSEFARVHTI